MKKLVIVAGAAVFAGALFLGIGVTAQHSANAAIHEQIGAGCRAGGEEVVPPGQVRDGMSFVRALQATGIIASIDFSELPDRIIVNFDLSMPNSKFISAGFDLTIEGDEGEPDLVLSPLPVPDPDFPAHANCQNLNP